MQVMMRIIFSLILLVTGAGLYAQDKAQKALAEGMEARSKKNYDEAIEKITLAIQLNPDYKEAYNGRGMVYLDKNSPADALREFREVVRIDPNWPVGLNNLGYAEYLTEAYREAIVHISKALSFGIASDRIYLNRGRCYQAIKLYDSAIADFSQVIKMKPEMEYGYLNRASAFVLQEQYEKAISDVNEAINRNPKNAENFNQRAVCYKQKGDYEKAIADFATAISMNGEKGLYYSNILSSLVRTLQFDKAKEYYKIYQEKNLKEINENEGRVYAYYMKAATEDIPAANYEQALNNLNTAATEYGDESKKLSKSRYTNILALKGFVLAKLNRLEEAQVVYEQTLAINPRQTDVREAISGIKAKLLEIAQSDKTGPEIELINPNPSRSFIIESDGSVTQIIGRAKDLSGIAEVKINNAGVAKLEEDGLFVNDQQLKPGTNEILITATDKRGNKSSKTFTLTGNAVGKDKPVDIPVGLLTAKPQKYYAILIAEKDYQDPSIPDLQNPVNDARDLKNILESQYNFAGSQVDTLFNRSREDILQTIVQRCNTLTENDNLVIFYAGHGTAEKDKYGDVDGYWIPVSAKLGVTSSYVSSEDINKALKKSNAKHILLIADACFSGAFTRSLPSDAGKAIQKQYSVPSRKIMASGNLEPVPDNSKFLYYLKKTLKENNEKYISGKKIFDSFYESILNNTANLPQYAAIKNVGDEGGEFIFIRK